jgi:hypothetical protein
MKKIEIKLVIYYVAIFIALVALATITVYG